MSERYEMPPEVTSLFTTTRTKTISDEDFVIVNGRVMLPQEVVARYYDMSVDKVIEAVRYARNYDPYLAAVIWHEGKMYFPTGDSVFAIKALSPYRNAEIRQNGAQQLNAFFDEIQNDLVDNKIYYEPDRTPPKKNLNSNPSNFWRAILILLLFLIFLPTNKKEPAPKQPAPVAVEQKEEPKYSEPATDSKPVNNPPPATTSKPALPPVSTSTLRGRGDDSYANIDYIGAKGFVGIYHDQTSELYRDCTPPWYIKTYERDNQLWVESETRIEHKTPVIVISTFLKPARYSNFEGYLLVKSQSDGAQFYINVKNFVTRPYWEERDLLQAARGGKFLVEYHQRSNYWPVDENNRKCVPPEGAILLLTNTNAGHRKVDNKTHQIWASGNEFSGACFNKADLTIVY